MKHYALLMGDQTPSPKLHSVQSQLQKNANINKQMQPFTNELCLLTTFNEVILSPCSNILDKNMCLTRW